MEFNIDKEIKNYLDSTDNYIEIENDGHKKFNEYYVTECIKEFIEKHYKHFYTEDDLRKAIEFGENIHNEIITENEFIKSLKPIK